MAINPFPNVERNLNLFAQGVQFELNGEHYTPLVTNPRFPQYGRLDHISYFLYRTNYYTNMQNDLLGVRSLNYLFSFWTENPHVGYVLADQFEASVHNFPPVKLAWRILDKLKEANMMNEDIKLRGKYTKALGVGYDPDDPEKEDNPLSLVLNPETDKIESRLKYLDKTNRVLEGIYKDVCEPLDDMVESPVETVKAKDILDGIRLIMSSIEYYGFTLKSLNKLDILRPQQIESGFFERVVEIEYLNG